MSHDICDLIQTGKEPGSLGSFSVYGKSRGNSVAIGGGTAQLTNPRYSNGNLRRKYRGRFKAMDAPCGICRGRLGPIHYDEPSDAQHPLSFVIDEIKPISRYREFGYTSKEEAAKDWDNLQAAHYCCNALKSNKVQTQYKTLPIGKIIQDGEW